MRHSIRFPLFSLLILIGWIGCKVNPYKATNSLYKDSARKYSRILSQAPLPVGADSVPTPDWWVGTTNFNLRKPNFVIIHHTAQNSCPQTLQTFTQARTQVSAHYVICRDGKIYHMLNDYLRAWQAGVSKWGNATDINSSSIGIELDNNGFEPFTAEQITSLMNVLGMLKQKYSIPTSNFIGHSDVAPGRKVDPNRNFPWETLSEKGYGLWFDTTCIEAPENFDTLQALRIIGYDIKNPRAAIQSFKLHFVQRDSSNFLTGPDKKILYDLSQLYQ